MWFVRLPLVLVCISWPVVVGAQDAPATGQTVTAPGGVAVGRDVKNSPITVYNITYEIDFNKPREQFKETAVRVSYGGPGNIPPSKGKGAIACYSHSEAESIYSVGNDIYFMGVISNLPGRYVGRIFQPVGYEGVDISAEQIFKDLCNYRFASCKNGCWAGGDTGGFYGYNNN